MLDPVLTYSTYFGGSLADSASGIAADGLGNVYVTGTTTSADFPSRNQRQANQPGLDAFVFKLDTNTSGDACDPRTGPPADKDQCKDGGWRRFDFPRWFKNQGDCIQFVNTGK